MFQFEDFKFVGLIFPHVLQLLPSTHRALHEQNKEIGNREKVQNSILKASLMPNGGMNNG